MRVNVGRIESSRRVDATGTLRRVQALNALGWPSRVLADRLGMQASTFTTLVHRPQVGVWFELRVQKLYVELENTPGPSKLSAARSRALRLAPPAAWDDIDDPEAKPQGVRRAA